MDAAELRTFLHYALSSLILCELIALVFILKFGWNTTHMRVLLITILVGALPCWLFCYFYSKNKLSQSKTESIIHYTNFEYFFLVMGVLLLLISPFIRIHLYLTASVAISYFVFLRFLNVNYQRLNRRAKMLSISEAKKLFQHRLGMTVTACVLVPYTLDLNLSYFYVSFFVYSFFVIFYVALLLGGNYLIMTRTRNVQNRS